ncbi:hypothetical protein EJ04DRAFT_28172 [Polyplosphaeria fusca]|uniref:Nephrocystin 3-like N-terminal domain-containing protein n=1 Tax=Polyplosphaeria fusca TaxID=682080 RepID=A0A9P4R873_9PLEO|nr:hypothetical protein EJ04DRAFT_28172 [Polyplosphaeria fusca]
MFHASRTDIQSQAPYPPLRLYHAMPRRFHLRDRLRAAFTPDPTGTSAALTAGPSPPHAQQATTLSPSSLPIPASLNGVSSATTTSRSAVLEEALVAFSRTIPDAEKAAFEQASKTIDEQSLLSDVRTHDAAHKDNSCFRSHAERLTKFLSLLDRFMGGVAIGVQASPEVSSLVVGAVRIVIDLALKFTNFFSRLTEMIYMFEGYLGPLAEYAKAKDIELVKEAVVKTYKNMLDFGWKARRVFIDASGSRRKWTSMRAFMRQHWEPFEAEFVFIEKDMQHNLDVLSHSVRARHFNDFRTNELARDREEKSKFLSWVSIIEFEKIHQDIYAKKHEETCEWLIKESKYQEWFNGSTSSLLWCHGKPGIGKSVLA